MIKYEQCIGTYDILNNKGKTSTLLTLDLSSSLNTYSCVEHSLSSTYTRLRRLGFGFHRRQRKDKMRGGWERLTRIESPLLISFFFFLEVNGRNKSGPGC